MRAILGLALCLVGCRGTHYQIEFTNPVNETRGSVFTASSQFMEDSFLPGTVRISPPLTESETEALRSDGYEILIDGKPYSHWFSGEHRKDVKTVKDGTFLMFGRLPFCELPEGEHEVEVRFSSSVLAARHISRFRVECQNPEVSVDENGNLFASSKDSSGFSQINLFSLAGEKVELAELGQGAFAPTGFTLQKKSDFYYFLKTEHGNGALIGADGAGGPVVRKRMRTQRSAHPRRRASETAQTPGRGTTSAIEQDLSKCPVPKNIRIPFLYDNEDLDPQRHYGPQRAAAVALSIELSTAWNSAISDTPSMGIPSYFNYYAAEDSIAYFSIKELGDAPENVEFEYIGFNANELPIWLDPGEVVDGRWEMTAWPYLFGMNPNGVVGSDPGDNDGGKISTNFPVYFFDSLSVSGEERGGVSFPYLGFSFISLTYEGIPLDMEELANTIAHESAHLLGLDHVDETWNLMFPIGPTYPDLSYAQYRMLSAATCGMSVEHLQFEARYGAFGVNFDKRPGEGCGNGVVGKNADGLWEYCEDSFHRTPNEEAVVDHNHSPEVAYQCAYHDVVDRKMYWPFPLLRCTKKCYCLPNVAVTQPPAPSRAPATRTPEGNSPSTPGPGDYGPSSPYPGSPGGGDPPDDDDDDDGGDDDDPPPGSGCRNSFIDGNVDLSCAVDDCPPGKVCKHGFSANNVHIGCACRPQIRTPEEPEDQFREMMRTPNRSSGMQTGTRR